ncbi:MAG: TonB-dependent receptor, partial [Bacteroidota bacterium]
MMKRTIRILITICILFQGAASGLYTQAEAVVSGYVRDAHTEEPLSFSTVLLPRWSTGVSANRFGFFSLKTILQDTVALRFSYVGYYTLDTAIVISSHTPKTIEILLKQKVLPLDEIEVVGRTSFYNDQNFPSTILLHQKQLNALPSIGQQDLLRSIQYFPGITFNSETSSSTYIRGGTPDQTLIVLDGMPVYNPSHAFGFFSMFHLDALKAVKVLKGGFPAEYGMRAGSVIDILSAEGSRTGFGGKGSLGLITSSIFLNGPVGDGSWMIAARRSYFDLLTGLLPSSSSVPNYYFYDVHARLNQDIGNQEQLKATVLVNQDKLSYDRPLSNAQENPVFEWSNKLFGA